MKIQLKMLGDLRQYLPEGGQFNRCSLDVAEDQSVAEVIKKVSLPAERAYLVILNGDMLQQADYENTLLKEADELTLFPPIKGG